MKFLVASTNTEDATPFLAAESQRIAELRSAGTIIRGWVKADFSGGILLLECADQAEALAALGTLPMVRNNATTFELTEVIDLDEVGPGPS